MIAIDVIGMLHRSGNAEATEALCGTEFLQTGLSGATAFRQCAAVGKDRQNGRTAERQMAYPLLRDAHAKLVFDRRVDALIGAIGVHVRPGDHILDVGAGDGRIALGVSECQPRTRVEGIDIMIRPETHIKVTEYDGVTIPFGDDSVDVVTFVDVLHHTDVQSRLIAEAARVARRAVIIKDHLSENGLDHATLRLMDWVGNAPHDVVLPYNYASHQTWNSWFSDAGLTIDSFESRIPLYPFPFSLVFGRGLHFVAVLSRRDGTRTGG